MAKLPVLRTKSVMTKVTEAEYARLESLAEASGVNMSEWMRGRLLGRDGADRDEDTATVLGEVLSLRTILHKELSRWARIPRDREAMHFLGDSGTGKSAAIRQLLSQIWERGEAAIVYDPAMEYLPQFYNEARAM